MTLKNLFSSKKAGNTFAAQLKEDRKRRIWPFVLFCLICFLMTVAFELNLESYIGRELAFAKIQDNLERLTRTGMITTYLYVAGAAACLFGFQGFGWLMKKDQVDFYHSQPIRRGERFKIIYINGILMCLIPMVLHAALYGALIGIRGYLNMEILIHILLSFGIFVISFFVMYHLVILSVMIAGNILVSCMLTAVLFTYATVVKYLVEMLFENFFVTYVGNYTNTVGWMGYFSPVEQIYRTGNYFIRGLWGDIRFHLLVLAAMAILFLAASMWLYKKRPSEAAGNALAFPYAGDMIRFLIVIPAGMLFGILFASVGALSGVFWLNFGTVVGVVLAHGLLEVVFHFDIKAILGKKVQLLASLVFVLCIVNVFCFDIFGYDTYIPEKDQVKTAAYYINLGEYSSNYRVLSEHGTPLLKKQDDFTMLEDHEIISTVSSYYSTVEVSASPNIYREDYQLEESRTEHIEPIVALVEAHMNHTPNPDEDSDLVTVVVHYEMKNGRNVYRRYEMEIEVLKEAYDPIYHTEEGKKVIYPYWNLSGEGIREVYVSNPFMKEKAIELQPEEIEELVECYKKDIGNQSLTDLIEIQYVGQIQLFYGEPENNTNVSLTLYIGKNHNNLIRFFEERDICFTLPNENYEVVEISLFNPYGIEDTVAHPFWQGREQVTLTVEQAENLIGAMIPDEYYNFHLKGYFLSGTIVVKNKKTGVQHQVYCNIQDADTPDYVKWTEEESK